jgi:hypothetical protein
VRRFVAIAVVLSAAFGFGLTAWAAAGGSDDETPASGPAKAGDDADEGDAGVHGGVIERLHAPGSCDLVSTGGLPGNWTHGDYVTAVAGLGNATLVVEAAHSGCGKPVKGVAHGLGVGHGLGPPAQALEHGAKAAKPAREGKVHSEDDGAVGS